MGEKYQPKKGDRVRVVLEGEVTRGLGITDTFDLEGRYIYANGYAVTSIEKIEPPVELFGPGDTVRGRATGRLFTLAATGYINHGRGDFTCSSTQKFTSLDFERVEIR